MSIVSMVWDSAGQVCTVTNHKGRVTTFDLADLSKRFIKRDDTADTLTQRANDWFRANLDSDGDFYRIHVYTLDPPTFVIAVFPGHEPVDDSWWQVSTE